MVELKEQKSTFRT